MKRTATLLLIYIISLQSSNGQDSSQISYLNIGYELNNYMSNSSAIKTRMRPLFISGEQFITNKISVGTLLSYSRSSFQNLGFRRINITFFSFTPFGNYHIFRNKEWDAYAGVKTGFILNAVTGPNDDQVSTFKSKYDGKYKKTGLLLSAHIGGRYFFKNNWGVLSEISLGRSLFTIGMSYRLNQKLIKQL